MTLIQEIVLFELENLQKMENQGRDNHAENRDFLKKCLSVKVRWILIEHPDASLEVLEQKLGAKLLCVKRPKYHCLSPKHCQMFQNYTLSQCLLGTTPQCIILKHLAIFNLYIAKCFK